MVYPWQHCTLIPPFLEDHSDAAAVGDVTDFSLIWQACFRSRKGIPPAARQLPNGIMTRTPTNGLPFCHMLRSSFIRGLSKNPPREFARVWRRPP